MVLDQEQMLFDLLGRQHFELLLLLGHHGFTMLLLLLMQRIQLHLLLLLQVMMLLLVQMLHLCLHILLVQANFLPQLLKPRGLPLQQGQWIIQRLLLEHSHHIIGVAATAACTRVVIPIILRFLRLKLLGGWCKG